MRALFWALIRRDMKVLQSHIMAFWFDGALTVLCFYLMYGHLLPLMGLDRAITASVFMGMFTAFCFTVVHATEQRTVLDLAFHRTIDYYVTLPISLDWLIVRHVVSGVIALMLTAFPVLVFGRIIFAPSVDFAQGNLFVFLLACLTMLLMITIWIAAVAFSVSYPWFRDNMWMRFLTPLLFLGCEIVPWKAIYAFSPALGCLCLLSPITFGIEGMRGAITGGINYLSPWLCIAGEFAWIIVGIILLRYRVRRRLDAL